MSGICMCTSGPRNEEKTMNSDGHIYRDDEENIPPEDKARLDGYLKAKAERDELDALRGMKERYEALLKDA